MLRFLKKIYLSKIFRWFSIIAYYGVFVFLLIQILLAEFYPPGLLVKLLSAFLFLFLFALIPLCVGFYFSYISKEIKYKYFLVSHGVIVLIVSAFVFYYGSIELYHSYQNSRLSKSDIENYPIIQEIESNYNHKINNAFRISFDDIKEKFHSPLIEKYFFVDSDTLYPNEIDYSKINFIFSVGEDSNKVYYTSHYQVFTKDKSFFENTRMITQSRITDRLKRIYKTKKRIEKEADSVFSATDEKKFDTAKLLRFVNRNFGSKKDSI